MAGIRERTNNQMINLVLDTLSLEKQALVFGNTKRTAESNAEKIANEIKKQLNINKNNNNKNSINKNNNNKNNNNKNNNNKNNNNNDNTNQYVLESHRKKLDEIAEYLLHSLSTPTKQCERLANCARQGVVFHHAGLTADQKSKIEHEFKHGNIKIISCTPTLAIGVDLPAFRTIITSLKRYGHRGLSYIPVLEYEQISGRAGRPSYDNHGESISLADSESSKEEIKTKFINGDIENIHSKLAVEPVLRTYLLSLISSGFVSNKKEIIDFFSKTFWAHQFGDMHHLESVILKTLRNLIRWGFIKTKDSITFEENSSKNSLEENSKEIEFSDFVSAEELQNTDTSNNNAEMFLISPLDLIKPTLIGKRIAELYIDPLTAKQLIDGLKKSAELKKKSEKEIKTLTKNNQEKSTASSTFPFLQLISHTLEIRPLLRVKVKEWEEIGEELLKYEGCLLEKEPNIYDSEYDDFFNSVKTALFFESWVSEQDEEFLLEKYSIRPGEIKYKLDIADWLLYCSEEFSKLLGLQEIVKDILKLRFRVKYGVKEELLSLLKLKNIGRVRARKLFNHGFKDLGGIKKTDLASLKQILGEKTALSIKKQLDQEIKPAKENKRKGQISLKDYSTLVK